MIKLRKKQSIVELTDKHYYIGRPSKYGNPYSSKDDTLAKFKVDTTEEAIQKYEEYLIESGLINDIEELLDKILVCFCIDCDEYKPNRKVVCHGQVLQKYLDKIEKQKEFNKNLDF
jgi:hypothetical protein